MTPRCQYDHQGHSGAFSSSRNGIPGLLTLLPAPALRPVLNGVPRIIAWQCPVCLRSWPAQPGSEVGMVGKEIVPVDAKARREAMVQALEERT